MTNWDATNRGVDGEGSNTGRIRGVDHCMETTRPVWYGFVGFVTGVGALGLLMWTFPGGVLAPITRDPAASPPPDATRVEVRPADTEHRPQSTGRPIQRQWK
jgi:hypothetical protein